MKQADEKMKMIQAEKDARQRKFMEEKIKEELNRKAQEEQQRRKRIWMEEHQKEQIKRKKEQEVELKREECEKRVKDLQQEILEEKTKKTATGRMVERKPIR